MSKDEFVKLINGILKKYGFVKRRRFYYLSGNGDLIACIGIQRSSFGNQCYLNLYFGKKETNGDDPFPKSGEFNDSAWEDRMETFGRINFDRKEHGGCWFDCDYINNEKDIDEVDMSIKKVLEEVIMPTLNGGIDYILDNRQKHRCEFYVLNRRFGI